MLSTSRRIGAAISIAAIAVVGGTTAWLAYGATGSASQEQMLSIAATAMKWRAIGNACTPSPGFPCLTENPGDPTSPVLKGAVGSFSAAVALPVGSRVTGVTLIGKDPSAATNLDGHMTVGFGWIAASGRSGGFSSRTPGGLGVTQSAAYTLRPKSPVTIQRGVAYVVEMGIPRTLDGAEVVMIRVLYQNPS